jgi:nucleoside-diphosphate-sugar epimerase
MPTASGVAARQRARATSRVVAITGACTYLGTELIRRLEEDPRYAKILVLDVKAPAILAAGVAKARFFPIDLTQPTVDGELATLLTREGVDTVVHGAFLSHPTHATEWAHEFEDVGTMHVLNACAAAGPRRIVMVSTTMVYGAAPRTPTSSTSAPSFAATATRASSTTRSEPSARRRATPASTRRPRSRSCGSRRSWGRRSTTSTPASTRG